MEAVAPQLGRAGHEGMLVVQPAAELLLTDGERVRIRGSARSRRAARRRSATRAWSVACPRRLEPARPARRGAGEDAPPSRRSAVRRHRACSARCPRTPRAARPGVAGDVEKGRGGLAAGRAPRAPGWADRLVPRQQGIEALEQMGEPEARVPNVGPLVLQPEDRAAHLAQKRGAIDLLVAARPAPAPPRRR